MKLLLTSQGLFNKTIEKALFELAGREADQLKVVFVPTAATFMDVDKDWLLDQLIQIKNQNFSYVDIVDIAALSQKKWKPRIEKADILIFGGGNPFDLLRWMKKSGINKILPELLKTKIYIGNSSGAIVMGRKIPLKCKELYECETSLKKDLDGLGFVDFIFLSHLNDKDFTNVNKKYIEKLTRETGETVYALDDDSAIVVDGDKMKVVSEGKWEKFE